MTSTEQSYKTLQTQVQDGTIPYVLTIELMTYSSGSRDWKFSLVDTRKIFSDALVWKGTYQDLVDCIFNAQSYEILKQIVSAPLGLEPSLVKEKSG